MSTEMLGRDRFTTPSRRSLRRRGVVARTALARIRGGVPDGLPVVERRAALLWPHAYLQSLRAVPIDRLGVHVCIVALTLLVLGAEVVGIGAVRGDKPPLPMGGGDVSIGAGDQLVIAPVSVGPIRIDHTGEPLAPALQRPVVVPSAFVQVHQLAEGETLGQLAARYGVSLESLVLANRIEQGDALVLGQQLRIPRVSGRPHVVAEGETVAILAERFAVPREAITTFPPNQIGSDEALKPGLEIFIPSQQLLLPEDWLQAVGGIASLAARGPEPAGVVRAAQTNLRTGPSTDHARVAHLDAGRRVMLRAQYKDWLQVELGPVRGWVRADLLEVAAEQRALLPLSYDFPPPPPRWVWPTRGTLTSGFGPRWGGFHNGIDIANRAWTPIMAARSGRVREAGWCRGYGYCVRMQHEGGVQTIYGHLIDRPVVAVGDEVAAGELIGHMGSTYDRAGGGYSTGVHLHFTVLVNGRAVNPLRLLP